jgi:hypothetical protein
MADPRFNCPFHRVPYPRFSLKEGKASPADNGTSTGKNDSP